MHADQEVGDYWMRSDNQNTCAGVKQALDIKGIFSYEGSAGGTPATVSQTYTTECTDEDHSLHVPIVPFDVSAPDVQFYGDVTVEQPNNIFRWYISGNTFNADWSDPTVLGILDRGEPSNYSGDLLINAPNEGEWVYIVVESEIPLPHPLHLHGHVSFLCISCTHTIANKLRISSFSQQEPGATARACHSVCRIHPGVTRCSCPAPGMLLVLSRRRTLVRGSCIVTSAGTQRWGLRRRLLSWPTRSPSTGTMADVS